MAKASDRNKYETRMDMTDSSDANKLPGFIPPHGGYETLKSYQMSVLVYDATVKFCDRFRTSSFGSWSRRFWRKAVSRSGSTRLDSRRALCPPDRASDGIGIGRIRPIRPARGPIRPISPMPCRLSKAQPNQNHPPNHDQTVANRAAGRGAETC